MLNKADLREVTFADLQALQENQIPESHTLDYKRDFPFDKDGRLSLAADVVAFANTRGGDLILGIEEQGGFVSRFAPVQFDDRDESLRSLQSALVDLVEPKVPGIHIEAVDAPDGGHIVIVRTPPSFQGPHRVRKNGVFYTRTSTGIDPMDITTLRSAFLQSANATEKARQFRESRIANIRKNPLPGLLPSQALAVLHVMPLASILGTVSFDVSTLHPIAQQLAPPFSDGRGARVNFDGAISYCGSREELYSYTQIFRDGSFESVMPIQISGGDVAWVSQFEESLTKEHHAALTSACQNLGLDGPAFVAMSYIDIGGLPIERPRGAIAAIHGVATVPAYYKNLLLPELLVDSFVLSSPVIYGPLFDMAWNAAGRKTRPTR